MTRLVHRLLPTDSEVAGLLALMLLTNARRSTRSGPDGELVPMAEQDRSRWDVDEISEGVGLVTAALPRGRTGPFQLQAAIAALHDEAPTAELTDWPQIVALYGLLARLSDNPMVRLNQAVAVAMVDGPAAGLRLVDRLADDPHLAGDHRLPAVRAHLLERAGEAAAAYAAYYRAAGLTRSQPQQRYLHARAARLGDSVAAMSNPADEDRIADRAHLLPEELAAGSDDPQAQAEAILADSDARTEDPERTRDESPQAPD